MAKLTDEQAIDIFLRCKAGEKHQKLADEFGVCRSAVSMIASRRQWKTTTAGL
jgi:transcriptional regulator